MHHILPYRCKCGCCLSLLSILSWPLFSARMSWWPYIRDLTLYTGNQTLQGRDTNLPLTVCDPQRHSVWREVTRDSFIDTDLCNNYTVSCMHYWSGLLIKSYFTVKVCWFDSLQHKSLLTSSWFGTPTAEWWMLLQINAHTHHNLYLLFEWGSNRHRLKTDRDVMTSLVHPYKYMIT